jgi:pyridoxal phosphate enzyme (YggS family)
VSELQVRLEAVRERMARALARAGRPADGAVLVGVTKTVAAEFVAEAVAAGLRELGENRIEEAAPKMRALGDLPGVRWHMIGHIQGRKAHAVTEAGFALVHSVDSVRLAERLSALAAPGRLPVLLECNVSGEASKIGFRADTQAAVEAFLAEASRLSALPGLELRGLMTMAPIVAQPDEARPCFARLRDLRDRLRAAVPGVDWRELSMGMTDDFEAALAEGATIIRVGRALFGERPSQ